MSIICILPDDWQASRLLTRFPGMTGDAESITLSLDARIPLAKVPVSTPETERMRRPIAIVRAVPPEAWAVGAITVAATILRIVFLGSQSLWFDEGYSAHIASLPWHSLVENMEPNMDLYYIMLHVWMWLGDSEFMLRLPSVIFSAATIPILYRLGKRLLDWRLGIIAALLMAVHAFAIQYAQEARSYSLVVLLVTISSLYLLKSLEKPTFANQAIYILAGILAVSAHLFAGLILAAQLVFLFFSMHPTWSWRRLVAIGLALVLLSAPVVLLVFRAHAGRQSWVLPTSLRSVTTIFEDLAGSEAVSANTAGRCLAALYLIALFAGVVTFARAWFNRSREAISRYGFLLSGVFVPLGLALAVSTIKPAMESRFFIVCLPFLILLTASAITQLQPRWLLPGTLVVFLSLEASQTYDYYTYSYKEDWRDAVQYVLDNAQAGDAAIIARGKPPYEYYRARLNAKQRDPVELEPRYLTAGEEAEIGATAQRRLILDPDWLKALRCGHSRVWLIVRAPITRGEALKAARISAALRTLYERHELVRQPRFPGVRVVLLSSSLPVQCQNQ